MTPPRMIQVNSSAELRPSPLSWRDSGETPTLETFRQNLQLNFKANPSTENPGQPFWGISRPSLPLKIQATPSAESRPTPTPWKVSGQPSEVQLNFKANASVEFQAFETGRPLVMLKIVIICT